VCPPRLAQWQVVIVPIFRSDDERASVMETAERLLRELRAAGIRTHLDGREGMKPGAKYYEWEARGVPLRLEVGPRDVAAGTVMLARRVGPKKESVPMQGLAARLDAEMATMQTALLTAARERREAASLRGATKDEFIARIEGEGGFIYAGFCGSPECENAIKDATKATIRVLPDEEFRSPTPPAACVWCGKPSSVEAVWAKAY
ncbi:MAG TPA: His/Gly/Thr/Pro-type tRNA ligase C-terminal domain-containing protein, partial [Gemmatimonadales bacterium]|nr:His/Gly/Thr/Pro-type tRNA ligase C-terminal domain-containing protein [Gemmatimonadales bacterium]